MSWVKAKDPQKPLQWQGSFRELRDHANELYEAIEDCCDVIADVLAENLTDYAGICRLQEILLPWAATDNLSADRKPADERGAD